MNARSPETGLRLILGSGSPRRLELLAQLGLTPDDIRPPDIDETPHAAERPMVYVARMAREKSLAVPLAQGELALCADTTVFMGRRIMGKAADRAEAERFLRALMGRRHAVATAVALRLGDQMWQRTVKTTVKMKRLSEVELTGYLDSEDWRGKAGAYGIQGAAGAFVPWIQGSFTSVVGLPVAETANLLTAAGYPVWGHHEG